MHDLLISRTFVLGPGLSGMIMIAITTHLLAPSFRKIPCDDPMGSMDGVFVSRAVLSRIILLILPRTVGSVPQWARESRVFIVMRIRDSWSGGKKKSACSSWDIVTFAEEERRVDEEHSPFESAVVYPSDEYRDYSLSRRFTWMMGLRVRAWGKVKDELNANGDQQCRHRLYSLPR